MSGSSTRSNPARWVRSTASSIPFASNVPVHTRAWHPINDLVILTFLPRRAGGADPAPACHGSVPQRVPWACRVPINGSGEADRRPAWLRWRA